jgi:hypothetical protein
VSTKILKARNTGNNKKLEKVKENEMNRQIVSKESTHTHIYIYIYIYSMDLKACQNNMT